ncbi:MAG: hypothetical protein ABS987_09570 [Ruminococcus sp.]
MKKTVIFAIIATLIAATITGCGKETKNIASKATADEATYDSVSIAETVASTEQTTTVGEPSSIAGTTEATQSTTIKPKTNSSSTSSKPEQSSASQSSNSRSDDQTSAGGNSSSQSSSPSQSHSGGQSSQSSSQSSKSDSQTSKTQPTTADPHAGKTWHNAEYRTVYHPAETKQVKVVDQEGYSYEEPVYAWRTFCNVCGADITENCQIHMKEHALAGEGGRYHDDYVQVDTKTITVPEQSHTETVVVKEAWTERVLVREAGWY